MKKLILVLALAKITQAQTIHSNRTVDWSNAGYNNSIPSPTTIIDITTIGGVGDSLTDNTPFLIFAIDSLHGRSGVIYFPSGNYIIGGTIDLPDSVVIRGLSSDSTHLIFDLSGINGNAFNITGSNSGIFANINSGAERNSFSIVVDDPSSFTAGDYAEIMQSNGAWDTQPIFWASDCIGQIVRIVNISGDTLFLEHALRINYDYAQHPRIQKINPAREVGIECLEISRNDTGTGLCFNIYFNYAANCWIKGVESSLSIGSHIEADASTNITITGCYIHHAHAYDGVSTHGYGITLFNRTGECLLTNNIMRFLRHSFSLQTGANGNVIAYNYSREPNRSEIPSDAGADISLHGHYPYANLFEGNIVQNIQIDQTWGPSGPFNTFFRNRAELYGLVMSSGTVQSDSMNFVGNEVTNTLILHGNYILAGAGHFEFGNNIKGVITPAGSTPLNDTSYFLSGPPSFWNISSFSFPSVGIPNALNTGSIPAKDRYLSGMNLGLCDEGLINTVQEEMRRDFNLYPNPSTNRIFISGFSNEPVFFILKDLQGKKLSVDVHKVSTGEYGMELPSTLCNGLYILEIHSKKFSVSKKVVVNR